MARSLTGIVSSDKANKTIVVTIQTRKTHPLYRKQYTTSKKFMVHDENNEAHVGDKVIITETRPLSARKRFVLNKIIEKAGVTHIEARDETIAEVTGQKQDVEELTKEQDQVETEKK
jgi:small subunit ribosomal protein S17